MKILHGRYTFACAGRLFLVCQHVIAKSELKSPLLNKNLIKTFVFALDFLSQCVVVS